MNNEKQRIAIAEARGMIGPFENSEEWFENGDSDGCIIVLRDATGKRVADYLNDLNAMHDAEIQLEAEDNHAYGCYCSELYEKYGNTVSLAAAQRAEAFLRTLNLWTNEY